MLYDWRNFFLHLGQVPGIHLPVQFDYTQKKREAEENLRFLKENFIIERAGPPTYALQREDMLGAAELEVVAYHSDCVSTIGSSWAQRLSLEWNCEGCTGLRKASSGVNPLRPPDSEMPRPGSIFIERSGVTGRWALQLFSQYEAGEATAREPQTRRLRWFRMCLEQVAKFMQEHGLLRLGLPLYVGCVTRTNREWLQYGKVLDEWHRGNAALELTLYDC